MSSRLMVPRSAAEAERFLWHVLEHLKGEPDAITIIRQLIALLQVYQ